MFRDNFYEIKIIGVVFSIVIEHATLSFVLVTSARINSVILYKSLLCIIIF